VGVRVGVVKLFFRSIDRNCFFWINRLVLTRPIHFSHNFDSSIKTVGAIFFIYYYSTSNGYKKTRKNAIVKCLDYQIPVTSSRDQREMEICKE